MNLNGKPSQTNLTKRYEAQKTRGTEGYGYVAFTPEKIQNIRRRTEEKEIMQELEKETAPAFIFHHRQPTSTPNFKEMAHPITTKNPRLKSTYYTIHNGIISNADERKKEHEKLGYSYTTDLVKRTEYTTISNAYSYAQHYFNDSEALAIDLAEYLDGNTDTIKTIGSVAAIVLEAKNEKPVALHWIRNNGNPLKLEKLEKTFFCLRSQGAGKEIKPDTMFSLDLQTGAIAERSLKITHTTSLYSFNDYHYPQSYNNYDEADELDYEVEEMLSFGYEPSDLIKIYRAEIREREKELERKAKKIGYTLRTEAEIEYEIDDLREKLRETEMLEAEYQPRLMYG